MNTIGGGLNYSTIKLKGQLRGKVVTILIYNGSTHSFVDNGIARELKLELTHVSLTTVAVADGQKLLVKAKCLKCDWAMQGHRFHFDLRVLELNDYDIILGMEWMKSCTPLPLTLK